MEPILRTQSSETSSSGLIFPWERIKTNEQEEDNGSPHLWRPGSTSYPVSLPYVYPMSARAEDIAKGRQELLKMFEGLPESTYELSLSDLVEQKDAMHKKNNQEANVKTEESEETNMDKDGKRKSRGKYKSGSTKKVGEDSKQFLLNIFVPKSLTGRSHSAAPKSLPTKGDDSEKGSWNKDNFTSIPNLLKVKTPFSIIGFSKVSPKPLSIKDEKAYQPLPLPSAETCYGLTLLKLTKLNRCSSCCRCTFFSMVDCQACGKSFCKKCVKVSLESTAEGKKCRNNCKGQFHSCRYSEVQINKCLPFLPLTRAKSERKSRFPLKDLENDCASI